MGLVRRRRQGGGPWEPAGPGLGSDHPGRDPASLLTDGGFSLGPGRPFGRGCWVVDPAERGPRREYPPRAVQRGAADARCALGVSPQGLGSGKAGFEHGTRPLERGGLLDLSESLSVPCPVVSTVAPASQRGKGK